MPVKRKITEFFEHLMAYGGISIENGIIYMWNDPDIFFPLKALSQYHYDLRKILGKEWSSHIYWMGRTCGYNSVRILVKKFGYVPKDIQTFLDAASQDGFGFCRKRFISDESKNTIEGEIELETPGISSQILLDYGKQDESFDFYICGVISGGADAAFGKSFETHEEKCIVKGDDCCILVSQEIQAYLPPIFITNAGLTNQELLDKTYNLYWKRKNKIKLITDRSVKFGDGTFYYKNIKGAVIANYMVVVSDHILHKGFGNKYLEILSNVAAAAIDAIKPDITKAALSLPKVVDLLKIFGYGEFKVITYSGQNIIISNENSPYPEDYRSLFGIQKESVCYFSAFLLKQAIELALGKPVSVQEKQCRISGQAKCIFDIKIL